MFKQSLHTPDKGKYPILHLVQLIEFYSHVIHSDKLVHELHDPFDLG